MTVSARYKQFLTFISLLCLSSLLLTGCGGEFEQNLPPTPQQDILQADKDNLSIIYADGDSYEFVTQNITLSTLGSNGSTIVWASSDTNILSNFGNVFRPSSAGTNIDVTLTATLTNGTSTATKIFELTVVPPGGVSKSEDSLNKDTASLTITYATGDSETHITQAVTLTTQGSLGSTITWSSSPSIISSSGQITRPAFNSGDTQVTLTATLTNNEFSGTKTFNVTVIESINPDIASVATDTAALTIVIATNDTPLKITNNIILPTSGAQGSTITWVSSLPLTISSTGAVTQPHYNDVDLAVILTATISKGAISQTKTFDFTVIKAINASIAIVQNDTANLIIGYQSQDNANAVTQNVTLATAGDEGSSISWASSNTSIISAAGVVTRPTISQSNASVTLLATITHGDQTDTKSFTVTALKVDGVAEVLQALCTTSIVPMLPEYAEHLQLWRVGEANTLNPSVEWMPVKGAKNQAFLLDGYGSSSNNSFNLTKATFVYDANQNGYTFSVNSDVNKIPIHSNSFNLNDTVGITISGSKSDGSPLATSKADLMIGKDYLEAAPSFFYADSNNGNITFNWCSVTDATSYQIQYGTTSGDLSSTTDASEVFSAPSDLTDGVTYYAQVFAKNANGLGKHSQTINVPANLATDFDLSIEKVTFNQAVQIDLDDNTNNIPIIEDKKGILRVFARTGSTHFSHVKATVTLSGERDGVALTPITKEVILNDSPFDTANSTRLPFTFVLNDLAWLKQGTSFSIQIDPNNQIAESNVDNNRYPASGLKSFGFQPVSPMTVRLINVTTNNGTPVIDNNVIALYKTAFLDRYPLSDVTITLHETTLSVGGSTFSDMLDQVNTLRDADIANNSDRKDQFYLGLFKGSATGTTGLAFTNPINTVTANNANLSGIALINSLDTALHEVGHNHGQLHVDNSEEDASFDTCATISNTDDAYPYNSPTKSGHIGKTGYEASQQRFMEKDYHHDIMSYCNRTWISDYVYNNFYLFNKKLDEIYSRTPTTSANVSANISARRAINSENTWISGTVVKGRVKDNEWKVNTFSDRKGVIEHTNTNSQYALQATTQAGVLFEQAITLSHYDHIDYLWFKAFIPTDDLIVTLQIIERASEKVVWRD